MNSRNQIEAQKFRCLELFEFAPDGYLVTNPSGLIHGANQKAAVLLGVTAENLSGKHLETFIPDGEVNDFRDRLNNITDKSSPDGMGN